MCLITFELMKNERKSLMKNKGTRKEICAKNSRNKRGNDFFISRYLSWFSPS